MISINNSYTSVRLTATLDPSRGHDVWIGRSGLEDCCLEVPGTCNCLRNIVIGSQCKYSRR